MSSPLVASVCSKSYELALLLIFVVVVTVLIVAVVDIDADVGRTGTRSKSICSFIGAWVLEVVPYVVVIACGAFLADDRPLAVADNVTDTISLTGTDIFPFLEFSASHTSTPALYTTRYFFFDITNVFRSTSFCLSMTSGGLGRPRTGTII